MKTLYTTSVTAKGGRDGHVKVEKYEFLSI